MLQNSDHAFVDPSKVRDYLLSSSHPIGRFKATVFAALGYSQENWQQLRDDLLRLGQTGIASPGHPSSFGQTFEVGGNLIGPSGRSGSFVTVWIVRTGEQIPRFVTAFPR